jgi:hypothetical protein
MATSEANICIFCGRKGGSAEHVFPDWITNVLPGDGPFTTSGSGKRTKESSRLAVTTRSVCIECNNTWMSEVETATKPVITPAILGKPVSWTSEEQRTIAVWATKTALTADSSYATRFAPEVHGHFVREAKTVPSGVQVSVGMLTYDFAKGRFDSATAQRTALRVTRVSGVVHDAYRVVLTVGQLALQVVGARDLDLSEFDWKRTLEVNGTGVTDFLRQLWPVVSDPLDWPPGTALDARLWALIGGTDTTTEDA